MAAMHPGTGANIDHVIGQADRVLIMLHHDHRVADIAQMDEGFEQAFIVALVQADRGFVQHIKHACEARADLRGQADALAFAT